MGQLRRAGEVNRDHPGTVGTGADVLRVQLLGAFRVFVRSRTIEESEWRLRKAAHLVKLLALAPGHRLHREQLAEMLWPDSNPSAGAINLRHALHVARRALGHTDEDPLLPARGDQIALECAAGVLVDVEMFEAGAASAHRADEPDIFRRALRLYTGDLLPEDRYEQWALGRREELRSAYLDLLLRLSRLYQDRGEIEQAIECLQQAITTDPANEEAHSGLMRLYMLSGQRSRALAQYETLKQSLRRELDADPDEPTERLYTAIAGGKLPPGEKGQPSRQRGTPTPSPGTTCRRP